MHALLLFALLMPVTKHHVTMTWNASASQVVAGYYVYRDGSKISGSMKKRKYTDYGVSPGTHSYYVTAWNQKKGESKPSNIVTATVP